MFPDLIVRQMCSMFNRIVTTFESDFIDSSRRIRILVLLSQRVSSNAVHGDVRPIIRVAIRYIHSSVPSSCLARKKMHSHSPQLCHPHHRHRHHALNVESPLCEVPHHLEEVSNTVHETYPRSLYTLDNLESFFVHRLELGFRTCFLS